MKPSELIQYILIVHPNRLVKFQTMKDDKGRYPFLETSLAHLMYNSHFLAIKEGERKYEILKDKRAGASKNGDLATLELMVAYAEDLGMAREVVHDL